MKFSALNREASNSSALSTPSSRKGRPTQEAQESACLKLYHNAMKLQQEGKWGEAKALYCEILESEVMEDGDDAPALSSTILRLKFLIYKNIASIAREQGDLSAAAEAYIEATCVDKSDVTVWYQLSSMGASLGNLLLARKALEQAVSCQPTYWPALESLCTVLYAVGDFTACLQVIERGLGMNPHFPRGLAYLRQIIVDCPGLVDLHCPQLRIHLMTSDLGGAGKFLEDAEDLWRKREALNGVIALRDPITPPKKLTFLTFSCLANCLLSLYKHCKELSQRSGSFIVPVDLSQFLDTSLTSLPVDRSSSSPAVRGSGEGAGGVQGVVEGGRSRSSGEEGKAVAMGTRREAKRKLWEALEPFAPKRRSSRVLTRHRDKDHTNYFDMLLKYLPPWLMMKQLPEIAQFSPLKKPKPDQGDENAISERKRQVSALIDSTPHLMEVAMVRRYVSRFQSNMGALQLLQQFLQLLALHYDQKWCRGDGVLLSRLFVELYDCLHGHLSYPSPLCSPVEAQREGFRRVAMLALCHVEMYLDTLKRKKRGQFADSAATSSSAPKAPRSFLQCLSFVRHCDGLVGGSALGTVTFTLRVQWCLAKWELYSGNHDSAMHALTLCRDLLLVFVPEEEEMSDSWNLMIHLPNCSNGGVISLDHVTEKLRDLEQSVSLKEIRQIFDRKEYSLVVQKLEPFLEYNTTIPTDFLMGSQGMSSDVTNLSLLLDSLLHLQRYYNCLQTAVQAALQLLQNYHLGNDLWTSSMRHLYRILDKCLSSSDGREQLWEKTDARLLKRLVVCLLKVMDVVYDMTDNDIFFSMPIALPWKMLYIVISNDWNLSSEVFPDVVEIVKGPPPECQPHQLKGPLSQEEVVGRSGCGPVVEVESEDDKMDVTSGDSRDDHRGTEGSEGTDIVPGGKGEGVEMDSSSSGRPQDKSDGRPAQEGGKMKASGLPPEGGRGLEEHSIVVGEEMDTSGPEGSGGGGGGVGMDVSVPPPPPLSELSQLMLDIDVEAGSLSGRGSETSSLVGGHCPDTPDGRGSRDSSRHNLEGPSGEDEVTIDGHKTLHDHEAPSRRGSKAPSRRGSEESATLSGRGSAAPSGRGSEELSVPLQFLREAHVHLGKMGWCCRDSGAFLLESIQALRKELRVLTAWPAKQREVLMQELEQCYYCLHGHPHKKARTQGLVDHNSDQIPLKWETALMLIEYYHPVPLPSIDDAKAPQVTPEVIHLYKRIVEVFPEHGKVLSKEALDNFIEGQSSELTDLQPPHQHSSTMSDVCYILADDALKAMDNHKAIRYYQDNLCYSPDQFDSWAGLALGRSRIILDRLNQRNFKSGMEKYIRKHTSSTTVCFRKAIALNNKHCYIIEKFGFFCYAIQSFASQILRQPRLFILSGIHPWAAATHAEMLQLARKCFADALGLEGTKHAEPWIYHWMLGKIGHKLQEPVKSIMTHLVKSAQILYQDEAAYPTVVEISSKLHAVEAVEVHYQLHSIALKHLLRIQSGQGSASGHTTSSGQGSSSEQGVASGQDTTQQASSSRHGSTSGHEVDKAKRVEVESSIAEALMQLKQLPLCQRSYPLLWEWTKDLCREAFRSEAARNARGSSGGSSRNSGSGAGIRVKDKETVGGTVVLLDCGGQGSETAADEEMDVDVVGLSTAAADASDTPTVQSIIVAPPVQVASLGTIITPPAASPVGATPPPLASSQAYTSLFQLCLYGVAVCAVRYPAFFKPLYRLAATLQAMGLTKHARKLLLGPLPSALTKCQEKLQPLFVLRTNMFTNMWQVPSEEVNRPGSFSSHARRNLELLVHVLSELEETQSLLLLAQYLRTKPDVTKQYLRDNERVATHTKVVKQCVEVLVRVSERELTAEEAAQYRTTATAIRSMASKLGTELIKGLDRATGCFQALLRAVEDPHESRDPPTVSCDQPAVLPTVSHDLPTVSHDLPTVPLTVSRAVLPTVSCDPPAVPPTMSRDPLTVPPTVPHAVLPTVSLDPLTVLPLSVSHDLHGSPTLSRDPPTVSHDPPTVSHDPSTVSHDSPAISSLPEDAHRSPVLRDLPSFLDVSTPEDPHRSLCQQIVSHDSPAILHVSTPPEATADTSCSYLEFGRSHDPPTMSCDPPAALRTPGSFMSHDPQATVPSGASKSNYPPPSEASKSRDSPTPQGPETIDLTKSPGTVCPNGGGAPPISCPLHVGTPTTPILRPLHVGPSDHTPPISHPLHVEPPHDPVTSNFDSTPPIPHPPQASSDHAPPTFRPSPNTGTGHLSSGLSHDIHTPLQGIHSMSQNSDSTPPLTELPTPYPDNI